MRNCRQRTSGAAEGALELPMSPRSRSVRVRRHPLALGPTHGGIRAAREPRGRDARGRVVVMETVWWEYSGKHGRTGDYMVDELADAWRYLGQYG